MAGIEQALTFKDPAGHAVSGILASPPPGSDRLVALCHGFLSNKNSHTNTTLTELLLPQDIATFRFDFFGQGESEGAFEEITVSLALSQALAALDLMHSKGYRKLALVGSSFGGLVALLAAAKWAKIFCLALKCPVPDFPEMLQLELGETEMARWKATDTIPNVVPGGSGRIKLSYAFYEDSLCYSGYDAAKVVTAPALIVQGAHDEYVPPRQILKLSESLGGPNSVAWLPDADHHFSRPEDFHLMTTLLSTWVADHLKGPLTS